MCTFYYNAHISEQKQNFTNQMLVLVKHSLLAVMSYQYHAVTETVDGSLLWSVLKIHLPCAPEGGSKTFLAIKMLKFVSSSTLASLITVAVLVACEKNSLNEMKVLDVTSLGSSSRLSLISFSAFENNFQNCIPTSPCRERKEIVGID